MSIRTEARTLTCDLTEDELLLRGDEMAKTYIQVAALDMQKKSLTAKIKPLDERIQELVTIIDTKQEERRVECRWVYSYDIGIKALIRPDTGEEIETGRIKDHERQQQLELETTTPPVDEDLAMGAEEPQPDPENVCFNTGCLQFEEGEPNHCRSLEYTSQCDNPQGTGAPHGGITSLCITCQGACGDFTPGTAVTECPGFDCELDTDQISWRDATCAEWRTCDYTEKCFSPAGEDEPDCLKELAATKPDIFAQVKTNRAAGMTLHDAVTAASANIPPEFGCKICGFDGGTKIYLTRHVEREHNLTMSQYKKQFPATDTALALARERRAKLIKGAK